MSVPPAVTEEKVRAAKWRLLCHVNMGSAGHTIVYSSADFPRLSLTTHTVRGKATTKLTVDGVEAADLAAAVQALNSPPPPAAKPPAQLDPGL